MKRPTILGADVSLNHGAFVLLQGGKLKTFRFVTDRASVAKASKEHGMYLQAARIKDMHERGVIRLAFWHAYLIAFFKEFAPDYTGVEDYAYRASMHAHQLGEVGGVFRYIAWRERTRLRFLDISSIKMFAADDGSAGKDEVRFGVQETWSETERFDKFKHGRDSRTLEDLCDAYAVARLVELELKLREGKVAMSSLKPKTIQVFNRTTSRWPVNILARDFIQRAG